MKNVYKISAATAKAYWALEFTNTRTDLENILENLHKSVYFNAISGNLATGVDYNLPLTTALPDSTLEEYIKAIIAEFTNLGYSTNVNYSLNLENNTYIYTFSVEIYWDDIE
jgi:predicted regulator of Ras-like GTPase activity (Roadblock/LC7/MglB family)